MIHYIEVNLIFTNPLTGFTFTVNEANEYARADGIIVHWFFAWGYLIAAIVQTAAAIIKTKSRVQKNRLRPLLFFPVLPTLCAISQMVFFGLSAMQAGITLSIMLIAFSSLLEQVSRDELTGLGNRRRLNEYIENALLEEHHFTLFMGDINGFKQINDKYGHIEGDKALQETADALRHACDHSSGRFTVFRYGGDEFVIISNHCTPEDVRVLNERIDRAITKKNDANKEGLYTLEISFGFAEGTCRTNEDVARLFSQADDAMYEDKKRRKAAREKE